VDYPDLLHTIENSNSIKALRSTASTIALIFSFLHHQYKKTPRVTVAYQELQDALDEMLDLLNREAGAEFRQSARDYLTQWSRDLHLLRIYHDAEGTPLADLTQDAERGLRWLEELRARPFVGTESRFLSIFSSLREIVQESTPDPEQRLGYLRAQQMALQDEIDRITATGQVTPLTSTQIRERFMRASEDALRLLSDFAAVEGNFRTLAREIQQALLQPDVRKGSVVGQILDTDEKLEQSDEGQSFRAFWNFMLDPAQKDEFNKLLREVFTLPDVQEMRATTPLHGLTRRLLDAGQKVIASNHLLAEQLRRMLDEQTVAESQRVRTLCEEIKQMAHQQAAQHSANGQFHTLELTPDVSLVFDRPLHSRAEEGRFEDRAPIVITEANLDHLNTLFNPYQVDQAVLERRIESLLETRDSVLLTEICEHFPIEKGVGEVLVYIHIAAHNREQHQIDPQNMESLFLTSGKGDTTLHVRLPRIRFRRRHLL
jgi:hypothetical protein